MTNNDILENMATVFDRTDFVQALWEGRPTEELVFMIEASPELAQDRGENGSCLPIHQACQVGTSLPVIKKLAAAYPAGLGRGLDEEDSDIPIFIACQGGDPPFELMRFLIDAYPECLCGTSDRSPLFHYLCRTGNSKEWEHLLLYVLGRESGVMDLQDHLGFYPIQHLAQGSSVSMLRKFMQKIPDRLIDEGGSHLLHFSVNDDLDTGHCHDTVAFLITEFPEAVAKPNERGDLPVHLALWPRDREALVKEDPYTLIYTGSDGRSVIRRISETVENKRSSDIQSFGDLNKWYDDLDCQENLDEVDRLLDVLNQQVILPTRRGLVRMLEQNDVPLDVCEQILRYAIPDYEAAIHR